MRLLSLRAARRGRSYPTRSAYVTFCAERAAAIVDLGTGALLALTIYITWYRAGAAGDVRTSLPADEARALRAAWRGLQMSGVVETADEPALPGHDQARDRSVVGADEGERPRPAGDGECLADDAAVSEHREPLTRVGRGKLLEARTDSGRERRGGFGLGDDVPALLRPHPLGQRVVLGDHPAEQAALPSAKMDLTQARSYPRREAEQAGERRGRLRGPAQRGHVDRVDVQRGEPRGDAFGLLEALWRERWVAVPGHEREGRLWPGGLRFAVPDQQQVRRTGGIRNCACRYSSASPARSNPKTTATVAAEIDGRLG